MDNQHLTHAGIKGMKWGIRRFQNKDGSLTPEGKRRYGVDDDSDSSEDYKRARAKSARSMSDQELRTAINRIQMEQQYAQYTAKQKSAGRKWVEGVITDSGKQIATKFVTSAATAGLGAALNKMNANAKNSSVKSFTKQMADGLGVGNMIAKPKEPSAMSLFKKSAKNLSDDELKRANARFASEKLFTTNKDLLNEKKN